MIPREQSSDLKPLILVSQTENSRIYKTNDGRLLKQVSNSILRVNASYGIDYEKKILHADQIIDMPMIAIPLTAVYNGNVFIGYTMYPFVGVNEAYFYDKQSLVDSCNLHLQGHIYKQLENIVIKGNAQSMVFPDICTGGNVMIGKEHTVSLLDFDGMQYGEYGSISVTDSLYQDIEGKSKYFIQFPTLFSPEVDKLSLLRSYFWMAFHINLHHVGDSVADSFMSLKDVFSFLGFEDEEKLFNKVERTLSDDKEGVFLGDEVDRIAREYQVIPYRLKGANVISKRLVKKS